MKVLALVFQAQPYYITFRFPPTPHGTPRMVQFLKKLWSQATPEQAAAEQLYLRVVEKARDPAFYATLGVPDTVNGRFDMIILHATLVIRRLREGGAEAPVVAQEMFDRMFLDFDRSLRELGVGDMSIGKQIKKMGKAFYGRAAAVEEGLNAAAADQQATLKQALRDTVFRQVTDPHGVDTLADYLLRATLALQAQAVGDLIAGKVVLNVAV